jgi:hypothetical protein
MTQAVNVIRDGLAFQARQFWLRAASLLDPISPVVRIGFESGPKAFDDLWVQYAPGRGPRASSGQFVQREHFQCKWHVTASGYGYADLIRPAFIGATSASLLERAYAAQRLHANDGHGVRYTLVTNWHPDGNDPLRDLVNTTTSALRLKSLFGTLTDDSRMGAVRKAWREHLAIDDSALRAFLESLGFIQWAIPPESDRGWLNSAFQVAGLRTVNAHESSFPHEDLVFRWMAQNRQEFDAKTLRQACREEGLTEEAKPRPVAFGIKSFEHSIDRLDDRCVEVLDLVSAFDDRFIHDSEAWSSSLYPKLQNFIIEAAKAHPSLRLAMDAHTTLAFAAGSVLNVKSGRDVELEQRSPSRTVWRPDEPEADIEWPVLDITLIELGREGEHIAVAIGLTHDIGDAVQMFVEQNLSDVSRILVCQPPNGAGHAAVRNGRHAAMIADHLLDAINATRTAGTQRTVHLFIAAPNAFTFMLGQRQGGMGPTALYEFDFSGERTGTYEASLSLPLPRQPISSIAANN